MLKHLVIMLSGPTLSLALWQSEQNYVVQLNTVRKHNRLLLIREALHQEVRPGYPTPPPTHTASPTKTNDRLKSLKMIRKSHVSMKTVMFLHKATIP